MVFAVLCLLIALASYPLSGLYLCYLLIGLLVSLFSFGRRGFYKNEIFLTLVLSIPPLGLVLTLIERRNTLSQIFDHVAIFGGLGICFLLICFNYKFTEKSYWAKTARYLFVSGYLIFTIPVALFTYVKWLS